MIADKMLILDKGKKIVEGAVKELFDSSKILVELEVNNPEHIYEQVTRGIVGMITLKKEGRIYWCFNLVKKRSLSLMYYLASIGAEVMSLRPKHSLEDYFLSLTSAKSAC